MPDAPKPTRAARSNKPTTPEDFPTMAPLPSGDYSYTVEIVMNMQLSMGRLTEAVEALKLDSRDQRSELKQISRDVHAAKVVLGVVGVLITSALAFLGWVIKTYLDYHKH